MKTRLAHLIVIGIGFLLLSPQVVVAKNACEKKNAGEALFPFCSYKSNYIVYKPGDRNTMDIKFQISAKFRLFNDERLFCWNVPLYLGFTQKSYWDIGKASQPFAEHDFNPELFLSYQPDWSLGGDWIVNDLQVGREEHESTGVAGPNSRSWNRTYIQPTVTFRDGGYWKKTVVPFDVEAPDLVKDAAPFSATLKLWYLYPPHGNMDIADFLGYGDLILQVATRREVLKVTTRYGVKHGPTVQVDLMVEDFILRLVTDLNFVWHFQYFNGYGDGLVKYNVKDVNARIGFLFTLLHAAGRICQQRPLG